MDKFEEFRQRVDRTLVNMDTKMEHLQNSLTDFGRSFDEFKDEMGDFMQFMAGYIWDYEERLARIEKHLNLPDAS